MTLQKAETAEENAGRLRSGIRDALSDLFCCCAAGDSRGAERCALGMLNSVRQSAVLDSAVIFKKCDIVSLFVSITSAAAAVAGERGGEVCAFSPRHGCEIRCCPELIEQSLLIMLASGLKKRRMADIRLAAGGRTVNISADTGYIDPGSMEYGVLKKTALAHRGRIMTASSPEGGTKTVLAIGKLSGGRGLARYDVPAPASLITDRYSPVVSALSALPE